MFGIWLTYYQNFWQKVHGLRLWHLQASKLRLYWNSVRPSECQTGVILIEPCLKLTILHAPKFVHCFQNCFCFPSRTFPSPLLLGQDKKSGCATAEGECSHPGEPHPLLSPTSCWWGDGVNPLFFSHLSQYLLYVPALHCPWHHYVCINAEIQHQQDEFSEMTQISQKSAM